MLRARVGQQPRRPPPRSPLNTAITLSPPTSLIALTATVAALLVPGAASAEYLVPEGNSAVTQYTEGFPTAGGEKKTEGNQKPASAGKTLGAGNARKLEDHGPDGAAAAELAAETAPTGVASTGSGGGDGGQTDRSAGKGGKPGNDRAAHNDSGQTENTGGAAPVGGGDGPDGSSGLSEILGAATGSSSGSLGLLLPLAILAALAWGLVFFWRQRQHDNPTVDGHR
jgi:hypothetical protein